MHRTPCGYRPETQSRHPYEAPGHGAYGRGSTCNYNVYSDHGKNAPEHVEDKYDVYKTYSGDAPGGARTWQQPQHEGAYGSYACYNQTQYERHDGSAWLPTAPVKYGEHNVPDAQAAYRGQYAKHDGGAWLPTAPVKYGEHNVPDAQAAYRGQYEGLDCSAWLPTVLAKYGEHNVPNPQAASCVQYAKYNGSAQLCYKQNEEQAAFRGLCYTENEDAGTKRLIETLATVGGRQGEGGQAGEQHRKVKMRKLYDPGNVQQEEDYDAEDWELE